MIEILPNWHPIFVHFSVALMTISVLLFLVSKVVTNWRVEDQLIATAYWNLWLAAIISIITVVAGWVAFNSVNHDTPSHVVMLEHRTWALSTLGAMVVLAIWGVVQYRSQKAPTWLFIAALLLGQGLVLGTAWLGGELVYRHGLGVKRLPNPDDHSHAPGSAPHSHGPEAGAHDHGGGGGSDHHDDLGGGDHHHDSGAATSDHHHDGDAAAAPHSHDDGMEAAHHHDDAAAPEAPAAPPAAAAPAEEAPPAEPGAAP